MAINTAASDQSSLKTNGLKAAAMPDHIECPLVLLIRIGHLKNHFGTTRKIRVDWFTGMPGFG
jgi:hypothetical protein